jgi:hypothetical protein
MPQIASTWETDMGQNDSIDDKKPKKKRASHILYYVIYICYPCSNRGCSFHLFLIFNLDLIKSLRVYLLRMLFVLWRAFYKKGFSNHLEGLNRYLMDPNSKIDI